MLWSISQKVAAFRKCAQSFKRVYEILLQNFESLLKYLQVHEKTLVTTPSFLVNFPVQLNYSTNCDNTLVCSPRFRNIGLFA